MPKALAMAGSGEGINHFNAVRFRLNGQGVLRSTYYSLDDVESATLPTITMATSTNREPTILANFIQQRAALRIETTDINEYFRINRIVIFAKPLWSSYPG